jgi:putative ribosome biogenesis GTPase RsgA
MMNASSIVDVVSTSTEQKLTILSGFFGAGKSTLINELYFTFPLIMGNV